MKLYTFDIAPNPRRLRLFLDYKGVELPTEEVSINDGEQFSEAFKAINPNSTLPTLVLDDGTALTETVGICHYLDSVYPEKPLMGRSDLERAQVVSWIHRLYVEGLASIAEMLRNRGDFFKNRALPGRANVEQIPALIERGKIRLDEFWSQLDTHLNNRRFFVGENVTQADIDAFVIVGFAGWVKEELPADCAALAAWYGRMQQELGQDS